MEGILQGDHIHDASGVEVIHDRDCLRGIQDEGEVDLGQLQTVPVVPILQQGDQLEITREACDVVDQRGVGTEVSYQEFHELPQDAAGAESGEEFTQALAAEGKVGMGEDKGTLLIPGGNLVQGKRPHDAVAGQDEDGSDFPLMRQTSKMFVDPELFDDILKREKVPVRIGGSWYGCDARARDPLGSYLDRNAIDVLPQISGLESSVLVAIPMRGAHRCVRTGWFPPAGVPPATPFG